MAKKKNKSKNLGDTSSQWGRGYVQNQREEDDWIKSDEVVYLTAGKCPNEKSPMRLEISANVRRAFEYLCKKLPTNEWALYLIGDVDPEDADLIHINQYELREQRVCGAHVVWIRDGLETSYIDEIKELYPGKKIGNVHSHNGMTPFASSEDREIMLIEGDFGVIVNNVGAIKAWTHFQLSCGVWVLPEVTIKYEQVEEEEITDLDLSLIKTNVSHHAHNHNDWRFGFNNTDNIKHFPDLPNRGDANSSNPGLDLSLYAKDNALLEQESNDDDDDDLLKKWNDLSKWK